MYREDRSKSYKAYWIVFSLIVFSGALAGWALNRPAQSLPKIGAVISENLDRLLKIPGVEKITEEIGASEKIVLIFKDAAALSQATKQGLVPINLGGYEVVASIYETGGNSKSPAASLTPLAENGAKIDLIEKIEFKNVPLAQSLAASSGESVPHPSVLSPSDLRLANRQEEGEMPSCLDNAKPLSSNVEDRRLIGYRWVRTDGTTCDPNPSDKVLFMTFVGQSLVPAGGDRNQLAYKTLLESKEYKKRRDFIQGNEKVWYSEGRDCGFQDCNYRRYYPGECGRDNCEHRYVVRECNDPAHYNYRRHYPGDCGISDCSYRRHYSGDCGISGCGYRKYHGDGSDCGYSGCSYRRYYDCSSDCGHSNCGYRRHYSSDCGISGCSHRRYYDGTNDCGHSGCGYRRHYSGDCGISGCSHRQYHGGGSDCGHSGCSYRRYYGGTNDCGHSSCSYRQRHYDRRSDCGVSGCGYRTYYQGGKCEGLCNNRSAHYHNNAQHYHSSGSHYHSSAHYHAGSHYHGTGPHYHAGSHHHCTGAHHHASAHYHAGSHYHADAHYHWDSHYHYRPHWHYDGHYHYFPGNFFDETDIYTGRTRQIKTLVDFPARDKSIVYPWETENFGVSLHGTGGQVELRVSEPSYQYAFTRFGEPDPKDPDLYKFQVSIGAKILTPADPEGIQMGLYNEGDTLEIRAMDKWGRFYQGEDTDFKIVLKKVRRIGGDRVIMDATFTLPAAEVHKMNLSDPKWKQYLKEEIEKGAEYYISLWGFRRANSKISEGKWFEKGKSSRLRIEAESHRPDPVSPVHGGGR